MGYQQSCCLFLFDTHTSNVVQYYLGSLTNPSIRTVDIQMGMDFTIIRINHGDMEGYGHYNGQDRSWRHGKDI